MNIKYSPLKKLGKWKSRLKCMHVARILVVTISPCHGHEINQNPAVGMSAAVLISEKQMWFHIVVSVVVSSLLSIGSPTQPLYYNNMILNICELMGYHKVSHSKFRFLKPLFSNITLYNKLDLLYDRKLWRALDRRCVYEQLRDIYFSLVSDILLVTTLTSWRLPGVIVGQINKDEVTNSSIYQRVGRLSM